MLLTNDNLKWDLSFIYKGFNDRKIDKDIEEAEQMVMNIANFRGKLQSGEISAEDLNDLFQNCEKVYALIGIPRSYGFLLFAQDTTNEHFQALRGKLDQKFVEISNLLIWVDLEINKMSDEVLEKYLNDPNLENYHHYMKVVRLNKPYVLTEEVEQVIQEKNLVGRDA